MDDRLIGGIEYWDDGRVLMFQRTPGLHQTSVTAPMRDMLKSISYSSGSERDNPILNWVVSQPPPYENLPDTVDPHDGIGTHLGRAPRRHYPPGNPHPHPHSPRPLQPLWASNPPRGQGNSRRQPRFKGSSQHCLV